MKTDLSKLEREIAIKIQENQMKQNGMLDTDNDDQEKLLQKETPIIKMNYKENTPLQMAMAKVNGVVVNGKGYDHQNQIPEINIKRSSRLRL